MCTAFPDLSLFYMSIYGGFGYDYYAIGDAYQGLAAGIPQTGNPPYTITDFWTMYPKFSGAGTTISGTLTNGSPVIAAASTTGVLPGQFVTGSGIQNGTIVLSTTSNSITLSQGVTSTGTSNVLIYENPPVSAVVIQLYLNLAYASLMQSRWREMWLFAMGWYIAHFLTLYLQSEGISTTDIGRITASGLERGILISKGAGDVNATLQALDL